MMTTEVRKQSSERDRRRLSTRHLGAFVAAASAPAVAMMAGPAPAHATTTLVGYWQGRCLEPGSNVWGYARTPYWMVASASAWSNCAEHRSSGWLSTNVYRTYDYHILAHNYGDGFVGTGKVTTNKTLQVQDSCTHIGYHHSHHVWCWSYRSH